MLIYDQPRSRGVENALNRARHLLGIRWTPQMEVGIQIVSPPDASSPDVSFLYAMRNGKKHRMPSLFPSPIPPPGCTTAWWA